MTLETDPTNRVNQILQSLGMDRDHYPSGVSLELTDNQVDTILVDTLSQAWLSLEPGEDDMFRNACKTVLWNYMIPTEWEDMFNDKYVEYGDEEMGDEGGEDLGSD
jgi:hypothetical protein